MTIEMDFLAFAGGSGANVLDQTDYAALSAVATGFQSGVAQSIQVNKVLRQASIMASVLAQYIVQQSGQPAIDDGTTATLLANLTSSIQQACGYGRFFAIGPTGLIGSAPAGVSITNTSGTNYTVVWSIPVSQVWVDAFGAGGCGNGSTSTANPGGGGGGGGRSFGYAAVTQGTNYTASVGLGSSTAGAGGGNTSFLGLAANGGGGGGAGSSGGIGTGGAGGTASGGGVNLSGGPGTNGIVYGTGAGVEGGMGGSPVGGGSPPRATASTATSFLGNAGLFPGGGSTGCTSSPAASGGGLLMVRF